MTFRDVKVIPLLGEMSQSDKRVAVFAEKPSPADVQETFVFRRRDTACRVRSGNQTLPINFSYRGNKHFRRGRLPRRPIHKNCITIFVWTRHAVSLRKGAELKQFKYFKQSMLQINNAKSEEVIFLVLYSENFAVFYVKLFQIRSVNVEYAAV